MQEHRIERYGGAAAAVHAAFVAPVLQEHMTETATTPTGRNGWTLQPKPGVPRSDRRDFQC